MLLNSLEWSSSTRTAAAQVSDYESGKRGRARRIALVQIPFAQLKSAIWQNEPKFSK
jgi:hypothetical protein